MIISCTLCRSLTYWEFFLGALFFFFTFVVHAFLYLSFSNKRDFYLTVTNIFMFPFFFQKAVNSMVDFIVGNICEGCCDIAFPLFSDCVCLFSSLHSVAHGLNIIVYQFVQTKL